MEHGRRNLLDTSGVYSFPLTWESLLCERKKYTLEVPNNNSIEVRFGLILHRIMQFDLIGLVQFSLLL